jgi:hypothetical protein
VHGDPSDLGADHLDLAHVDARPDVDAHALQAPDDLDGTVDRSTWLIEGGEEPVASRIDLPPSMLAELSPDEGVVSCQELPPPPISQLGGQLS